MNNAIQEAINKLSESCPSCAGPDAPKIIRTLKATTYVYRPEISDCGGAVRTPPYFRHIDVGGHAFDPNRCCSLASTLTHEAYHLGVGTSEDQAYKIEKDCFNCGTGHPPSSR